MKKSQFEYLNKLLAILDASKVDMVVNLSSTWGEEDYDVSKNIKVLKINPYLDSNRSLVIPTNKKEEVLRILENYFEDSDYYHYKILFGTKIIGLGFDSCAINYLNPDYFNLTIEHLDILEDDEIIFRENIE